MCDVHETAKELDSVIKLFMGASRRTVASEATKQVMASQLNKRKSCDL